MDDTESWYDDEHIIDPAVCRQCANYADGTCAITGENAFYDWADPCPDREPR